MISRSAIVAEAHAWLGTPFVHQASLKGVGCDCIGLLAGVGRACGHPDADRWDGDPRRFKYGRLPVAAMLRKAVAEYFDVIDLSQSLPGDVLLLTFLREPMHFGILTEKDPLQMIHSYQPIGRVVENGLDAKWRRRILGAYRIRGTA